MKPMHLITAVVAASLLLSAGCSNRNQSVELEELRAENQRLSDELNALYTEARLLEDQRNKARDELVRLREQTTGLERQLQNSLGGNEMLSFTDDGIIVKDVAFNPGSADLTNAGLEAIRALARELNNGESADTKVIVVGHTDNTPVSRPETKAKFGDNWGLSAMRAASVIRTLQSSGVTSERLRGSFRGEYSPRSQSKAENRRVEIFLAL